MSDKENTQKENKPKKERTTYPRIEIPLFLFAKAERDKITKEQLLVYCWYWTKNHYFAGKGKVFGRPNLGLLDQMVQTDLCLGQDQGAACRRELEKKGWLQKANPWYYEGVRQVGRFCMPDKSQSDEARAQQQELHLQDEEAVTVKESSVEPTNNGVYCLRGERFYNDSDGNPQKIPSSAPPRPTTTAVWDNDTQAWYEPDDLPTHDLEY